MPVESATVGNNSEVVGASPRITWLPVIVVGYRNAGDIVDCIEALSRSAGERSVSIFVCENGGAAAAEKLVAALATDLCEILPEVGLRESRFEAVTALNVRGKQMPVYVGLAVENLGYAGGVNAWLRELLGSPTWSGVWLLNPDAQPLSGAIDALVGHAEALGLGMTGSRLVSSSEARTTEARGLRWRLLAAKTLGVGAGWPVSKALSPGEREATLHSPSGASIYVSKACIEAIGLMQEQYFLYYEDLEWGLRALRAGFRIGYAHESVVVHSGGTTIGSPKGGHGGSPMATYLEFRNRLAFVRANFPLWTYWSFMMALLHAVRLRPKRLAAWAVRGTLDGMRGRLGRPDAMLAWHGRPEPGSLAGAAKSEPPGRRQSLARPFTGGAPAAPTLKQELILNFHGVGSPPPSTPDSELKYWIDIAPFRRTLDAISACQRVMDDVNFTVTFDDGNASDAEVAAPELHARGMSGKFFVLSDRIGQDGFLDSAALATLRSMGMTVGSHGAAHRNWRLLSDPELFAEIDGAKAALENIVRAPIAEVAIPFGAYDRRVLEALRRAGFWRVYSSDGGMANHSQWLSPRNTVTENGLSQADIEEILAQQHAANKVLKYSSRLYKRLR